MTNNFNINSMNEVFISSTCERSDSLCNVGRVVVTDNWISRVRVESWNIYQFYPIINIHIYTYIYILSHISTKIRHILKKIIYQIPEMIIFFFDVCRFFCFKNTYISTMGSNFLVFGRPREAFLLFHVHLELSCLPFSFPPNF